MYLTQVSLEELRAIIADEVKKAVAEAGASGKSELNPAFDELITEAEAVSILKVSKVSLKKWRDESLIPFYRFGTRIRYRKNELIESVRVLKRRWKLDA